MQDPKFSVLKHSEKWNLSVKKSNRNLYIFNFCIKKKNVYVQKV